MVELGRNKAEWVEVRACQSGAGRARLDRKERMVTDIRGGQMLVEVLSRQPAVLIVWRHFLIDLPLLRVAFSVRLRARTVKMMMK